MMVARIFFQKKHSQRFTSTLDMQKIWERSLRRASFSVNLTQGFHPHPRIRILRPLPLGFTGENEIVEIEFSLFYPAEEIKRNLNNHLPEGIIVNQVSILPVTSKNKNGGFIFSEYVVTIRNSDMSEVIAKQKNFMLAEQVIRVRNGKEYDLRQLIHSMEIIGHKGRKTLLKMQISAEPERTGRPDEVINHFGYKLSDCTIVRKRIY